MAEFLNFGPGEDFMGQQMLEIEGPDGEPPTRRDVGTWITRAGDELLIYDMSDDHLTNAIRMLRRNGVTRCRKYVELVTEADERGLDIDA